MYFFLTSFSLRFAYYLAGPTIVILYNALRFFKYCTQMCIAPYGSPDIIGMSFCVSTFYDCITGQIHFRLRIMLMCNLLLCWVARYADVSWFLMFLFCPIPYSILVLLILCRLSPFFGYTSISIGNSE